MVKYLLSAFNPDMVNIKEYETRTSELSEEEFNAEKVYAISVIQHPGFARLLNVPRVKKYLDLKIGDELLVVGTKGGKLDYHAKSLPAGLSLRYRKIKIEGC